MTQNLCRLCLGTVNLVWVFNLEAVEKNLIEIIEVICGVKICREDTVSQMVCSTCCQVTIKMYEFRIKAIKNDRDLKAQCSGYKVAQTTITPTTAKKRTFKSPTLQVPKKYVPNVHFSVKEIIHKYPNLILPRECFKSHLGAYITLLSDEIDSYLTKNNLKYEDIGKYETSEPKKMQLHKRKKMPKKEKNTASGNKRMKLSTELIDGKKSNHEKTRKDKQKKHKCDGDSSLVPDQPPEATSRKIHDQQICDSKNSKDLQVEKKNTRLHLESIASSKESEKLIDTELKKNNDVKSQLSSIADRTIKGLYLDSVQTAKDNEKVIEVTANKCGDSKNVPKISNKETVNPSRVVPTISQSVSFPINFAKSCESEITLKSTLSSEDSATENALTEVIDNESKPKPQKFSSQAVSLLDNFISRPFVVDQPKASDGNDDDVVIVEATNDSISEDIANLNSADNEASKSFFVEALQLVPKDVETNNQPDLSLVSLAVRTKPLYTCRICYSQHFNLFALRNHERKNHTRCPFCGRKFYSLIKRSEHVINSCERAPVKMKDARLMLTRVDEDEHILKRYPGILEEKNCEKQTNDWEEGSGPSAERDKENAKSTGRIEQTKNSPETKVDKLEKVNCSKNTPNYSNNVFQEETAVICISDKEKGLRKCQNDHNERMINVVNNDIVKDINIHDDDHNILKRILTRSICAKNAGENFLSCPIVDGDNNTKIFKNLRKHLPQHHIPLEMKYGPKLAVEYEPWSSPAKNMSNKLWDQNPTQIKSYIKKVPISRLKPRRSLPKVQGTVINTTQVLAPINETKNILINNGQKQDLPSTHVVASVSLPTTNVTTVTTSTAPLILNHAQMLPPIYKSFVLLPGSFTSVPQIMSSAAVTIPNNQSSVKAAARLESVTNPITVESNMTNSTVKAANIVYSLVDDSKTKPTQPKKKPTIRVKNIIDLS